MRSLWLKLMGAFALVILVGGVTDSLLIYRATSTQFSRFITENGQRWAQQLAPGLTAYYARNGSWQDVESILANPWMSAENNMQPAQERPRWTENSGMMGGMMNGSMMNGGMMDGGMGMMGDNMLSWMGVRLLLADEEGQVAADTASSALGTILSAADLAAGTPLVVDGRQVGTILAVSADAEVATPAGDFLSAINRSTWLAGLVAGALALALGMLLFRQIIAPVKAVTVTAQQIAAGQLNQRVPVSSHDEVGQLAEAFNQMAESLAHDRQLRQNMMADIAHELRTPLSIIQANLEAMLDGVLPATPPEIASLHDETTLLARLVTDLRLLSLAEAGQLKLDCAETDIGDLIEKVSARLALQASEKEIEVVTVISPDLPLLDVDADRLGQAIGNLVDNALRYTPERGRVVIKAAATGPNSIVGNEQQSVVIEVSDTGPGIDPHDLDHIFDRFYRVDKSRNREAGGSGIGLAIVKQLVEAHGGRVTANSTVGQGTRFTVVLPASGK